MRKVKIQMNFKENGMNLDGSSSISEFDKYVKNLKTENALMIVKNTKKQFNYGLSERLNKYWKHFKFCYFD